MIEKPAYSLAELLTFHPAGRSEVYEDISAGRPTPRKIGDKTIIIHPEYIEYLDALPRCEVKDLVE